MKRIIFDSISVSFDGLPCPNKIEGAAINWKSQKIDNIISLKGYCKLKKHLKSVERDYEIYQPIRLQQIAILKHNYAQLKLISQIKYQEVIESLTNEALKLGGVYYRKHWLETNVKNICKEYFERVEKEQIEAQEIIFYVQPKFNIFNESSKNSFWLEKKVDIQSVLKKAIQSNIKSHYDMEWSKLKNDRTSLDKEKRKLQSLKSTVQNNERELLQREESYRADIKSEMDLKYNQLVASFENQKQEEFTLIQQNKEGAKRDIKYEKKQLLSGFEDLKKKEFDRLYNELVSRSKSIIDELANEKANKILEKLGVKI